MRKKLQFCYKFLNSNSTALTSFLPESCLIFFVTNLHKVLPSKIAKEYFHEDFQVFGKRFANILGILFFKLHIINTNTSFYFWGIFLSAGLNDFLFGELVFSTFNLKTVILIYTQILMEKMEKFPRFQKTNSTDQIS